MSKRREVLIISLSTFVIGCTGNISDSFIPIEKGGIGIIIPGKSVEGVELGDSPQTVYDKLGKPTSVGWTDGIYRSWRMYAYEQGPHAGLIINFIDSGATYGPVDVINIEPPYSGKTKENIGLGTSLIKVHKVYGLPDTSLCLPDQNWIADYYCINQKMFQIHYEDSIVSRISTGYLAPISEDPFYPCR
jgi:hypothetical protein